jgi:exopolysaccharide production protein ExoZ
MRETDRLREPHWKPVPREISTINYGRGLAALCVVLFHFEGLTTKYFDRMGANGWFLFGRSGVEYFFVLSGFIIFNVHGREIGEPDKLRAYAIKRLIRILPMFWVVVVPVGLVFMLDRSLGDDRNLTWSKFALDSFLVPREGILTLPPAWTLQHEAVFYFVFAMVILSIRWGWIVFFGWQLACVVTFAFALIPVGYQNLQPLARLFGHENFGFLFGLIIACLYGDGLLSRHRRIAGLVGLFGFILLAAVSYREGTSYAAWAPDSSVVAIGFFLIYSCIMVGLLSLANASRRDAWPAGSRVLRPLSDP